MIVKKLITPLKDGDTYPYWNQVFFEMNENTLDIHGKEPHYLNHARYENHTLTSYSGWSATLWNMFNRVVTKQNVVIYGYTALTLIC